MLRSILMCLHNHNCILNRYIYLLFEITSIVPSIVPIKEQMDSENYRKDYFSEFQDFCRVN
jgi:hypothetical protein